MKLPITTIVAGSVLVTQMLAQLITQLEDLGVIMGLIGSTVFTISDSAMAVACANTSHKIQHLLLFD